MHARLLSAVLAGLSNPIVKLKSTFPVLTANREIAVRIKFQFSNLCKKCQSLVKPHYIVMIMVTINVSFISVGHQSK